MSHTSEKYRLLQDQDRSDDCIEDPVCGRPRSRYSLVSVTFLVAILVLSIVANIFLVVRLCIVTSEETAHTSVRSKFAGLKYEVETPIYASTEYGPAIGSAADRDALWAAIDISPGVLAIPDGYAEKYGLPRSQRFPWDQSQGVYLLGSYHTIHCLKQIQRLTSEYNRGVQVTVPYRHVEHCLDTLLQDTFCHADDTPWYQLPPPPAAQNYAQYQVRQCRSWDQLLAWASEFNACFKYDNVSIPAGLSEQEEQLEHYRFCPEGSPHARVMELYYNQKKTS